MNIGPKEDNFFFLKPFFGIEYTNDSASYFVTGIYFEDNFALIKELDKLILISNLKNLTYSEINNLKVRLQGVNRKLFGYIKSHFCFIS